MKKNFTIRLSPETRRNLTMISKELDRNSSDTVRVLIDERAKALKSGSRPMVCAASMGGSDDARQGVQA